MPFTFVHANSKHTHGEPIDFGFVLKVSSVQELCLCEKALSGKTIKELVKIPTFRTKMNSVLNYGVIYILKDKTWKEEVREVGVSFEQESLEFPEHQWERHDVVEQFEDSKKDIDSV